MYEVDPTAYNKEVRCTERLGSERSRPVDKDSAVKLVDAFQDTPPAMIRVRQEETLPGVWLVLVEVFNDPYWWTVGVISGYSPLKFPHRSSEPA